jgi:serine/threonine protein phosphatase PrpC
MITYRTHTEPGGHAENQDCLRVSPVVGVPCGYLCAVADGQGGQAGAALAASIACQSCLEFASSFRLDRLLSPLTWPVILRQSDEAVAAAANAGFTTLIGFCLTEDALCGGSSGDSAVLLLSAGQSPRILTDRQVKNPPVGSGGAGNSSRTFIGLGSLVGIDCRQVLRLESAS